MSILKKQHPRTAAQIGAEIPAAQRQLQDLEAQRKALALAVQEGASDKELRDIDERIRGQRVQVKNLMDARDAAAAREHDEGTTAERAAAERARVDARKHNAARSAHGENIEKGAELLARGLRGMLASGASMIEAVPGTRLDGAMVSPADVLRAIAQELWRVSATAGSLTGGFTLPGAAPGDQRLIGNPGGITPFTEKVAEAQRRATELLSGKAAHAAELAA